MKNKNIHAITSAKKAESDLRKMLNGIQNGIVDHLELMAIKATLCREYYNSLVKEGFEKTEALELCKYFTTCI